MTSAPQHTTPIPTVTIFETAHYAEAQAVVDRLSDNDFPVEATAIVGSGLHTVENVTGRMTTGRAAGMGALSGLWFGLLIGLLFGILVPGGLLPALLWGLVLGAVWGLVFGAIGHAMTRGKRDFAAVKTLEASTYTVTVHASEADRARSIIA